MLLSAVLVSALLVLQPLVPQASFQRLATIRASIESVDLGGRADIWREGITVFSEHPLLGVGSGAFRSAAELGRAPHNFVVSLTVELAIIGFGIFTIILAMAVYYARYQPKLIFRLWLTILLVWVLSAMTHNFEHDKPIWLFLSLVFVGAALSEKRDERATLAIRGGQAIEPRANEKAHFVTPRQVVRNRYYRKRSSHESW